MFPADVGTESNTMRALDLGGVGCVLKNGILVFKSRVRVAHGGVIKAADDEVRHSAGPRKGADIGTGDAQHIGTVAHVGQVGEKQLVPLRDSEGCVDDERRVHYVCAGSGHRQSGAILEIISSPGVPVAYAAASTQRFSVNRRLKVVIGLVTPAPGESQFRRGNIIELGVDLMQ